jgi:hypothetical protein
MLVDQSDRDRSSEMVAATLRGKVRDIPGRSLPSILGVLFRG